MTTTVVTLFLTMFLVGTVAAEGRLDSLLSTSDVSLEAQYEVIKAELADAWDYYQEVTVGGSKKEIERNIGHTEVYFLPNRKRAVLAYESNVTMLKAKNDSRFDSQIARWTKAAIVAKAEVKTLEARIISQRELLAERIVRRAALDIVWSKKDSIGFAITVKDILASDATDDYSLYIKRAWGGSSNVRTVAPVITPVITPVTIPVVETPVVETPVVETPVVETPVEETTVVETPVVETPVVETPVVETAVVYAPVVEMTSFEDQVQAAHTAGYDGSGVSIKQFENTGTSTFLSRKSQLTSIASGANLKQFSGYNASQSGVDANLLATTNWGGHTDILSLNAQIATAGAATDTTLFVVNGSIAGGDTAQKLVAVNTDNTLVVGAIDSSGDIIGSGAGSLQENFIVVEASDDGMATTNVAGSAALVMQKNSTLTKDEIQSLILNTATDIGILGTDEVFGRGQLNLLKALSITQ